MGKLISIFILLSAVPAFAGTHNEKFNEVADTFLTSQTQATACLVSLLERRDLLGPYEYIVVDCADAEGKNLPRLDSVDSVGTRVNGKQAFISFVQKLQNAGFLVQMGGPSQAMATRK